MKLFLTFKGSGQWYSEEVVQKIFSDRLSKRQTLYTYEFCSIRGSFEDLNFSNRFIYAVELRFGRVALMNEFDDRKIEIYCRISR